MTTGTIQSMIRKQIKPAIVIFLLLTLVTGIVYPLFVTGIAQVIFPVQANGNLIQHNGNVAGSALVGQPFSSRNTSGAAPRQRHHSPTMPEHRQARISGRTTLHSSMP